MGDIRGAQPSRPRVVEVLRGSRSWNLGGFWVHEAQEPDDRSGNPDVRSGNPDVRSGNPDPTSGNPDPTSGNPDRKSGNPDPSTGSRPMPQGAAQI